MIILAHTSSPTVSPGELSGEDDAKQPERDIDLDDVDPYKGDVFYASTQELGDDHTSCIEAGNQEIRASEGRQGLFKKGIQILTLVFKALSTR